MKATALMYPDNSTNAHFTAWAFGSGQWPTPTTYGFSSFIYNAGFLQTGNSSTFAGTLERGNIIGDGQLVWQNITFNVTSTASSGTTATYGFSGLSGGALRVGMYIASITGTTNDSGSFNITIPTQVVVIESVTYTTSTSGTFTTYSTLGSQASQAETGTGQINATVTTYWLDSTQTLPANNASVGSTSSAAYGNTATGQTTFKGYWQSTTTYSIGDVVTWVSSSTGTTAVIGVFASLTNSNTNNSPPTTNTPNTNWTNAYNYEIWETADSALPAYVQSNQATASVTFNPVAYNAPNTAGNTLVVFARFTGGSGTPTIKDTNGNTWVELFSNTNGSDINVIWAAYGAAGTTTTNYVTVAQPTQNTLQIAIAEYSGVTSVSPQLDQSTSATGTSTSANSGSATTTQANELILGFIDNATSNGLTVTPTNGFTARQTVNGNLVLMDKTVTATGSYAATATLSSSVAWFAAVATLKGTQLPAFYFKFEYGNIGTNVPALGFQIGTAITFTGALASSGLRGFREIIGYSSSTASSGTQYETDFYADGTAGLTGGKFGMIGWRTGTNQNWFLGWERSKNNFGVDTGLYITYLIGQNPNTAWRQSSVFATGGNNFAVRTTSYAISIETLNAVSFQTGNSIPVLPVFPSVGYLGNPLTVLVGLTAQDTSEGAVFTSVVYNANHNYLMTKGGGTSNWAAYFTSTGNSGIALRWE
jgi:hypothetical protein